MPKQVVNYVRDDMNGDPSYRQPDNTTIGELAAIDHSVLGSFSGQYLFPYVSRVSDKLCE